MAATDENINPGEKLQSLLKQILPQDARTRSTFLNQADNIINGNGQLADLIYNSTINYILRRLILTAEFLERRLDKKGIILTEEKRNSEFRHYVRTITNIKDSRDVEKIVFLLKECLNVRRKTLRSPKKKNMRREAQKGNKQCYMCGCEMDFSISNTSQYEEKKQKTENKEDFQGRLAEIEHIWPRALGGLSKGKNLEFSCKKCNRTKGDTIDASDFHYEHLITINDEDDDNFSSDFNREFELSIWSKNNFRCALCNRSVSEVGELFFLRGDENDSWHFLNVESYCSSCYSKIA